MNVLDTLIEVKLAEEEDFLKVKETLTRIGVASRKDNILYQSCHIFHEKGKYYIVHFKELFMLDGKPSNFSDEDKGRRNTITSLLQDWGLVTVINNDMILEPKSSMNQIKIVAFKDKKNWKLETKYNVRKRKPIK